MHLKLLQKKVMQTTEVVTSDLNGNKIADRIIKISKSSQQSNSETVTSEHDKEIPKEIPKKRFRMKNWVGRNDDARGTYNTNSQTKFKTPVLKSILCDYSDAYILVSGTITVA